MNLNVALCDDGIEVFQKVQRLFQEFSKENNVQISIDWFSSGESLLECLEDYSLILLDIAIPEMDGIAFGREAIRRKYSGKIIMLTGELERFTEAFEIQAFRFVIKPIEKEKLFKALRDFLKTRIGEKDVIVYWERKKVTLKEKEIYYILRENNTSKIFTKSELFHSQNSLDKWGRMLDNRIFARCNRQTLVNVAYILKVDSMIWLTNQESLSYSRRGKRIMQEVMDKYDLYYR